MGQKLVAPPFGGHLRNSILYLVPMGSRGRSGFRGGGPEAGGASLGWAISRIFLPNSHGGAKEDQG